MDGVLIAGSMLSTKSLIRSAVSLWHGQYLPNGHPKMSAFGA